LTSAANSYEVGKKLSLILKNQVLIDEKWTAITKTQYMFFPNNDIGMIYGSVVSWNEHIPIRLDFLLQEDYICMYTDKLLSSKQTTQQQ